MEFEPQIASQERRKVRGPAAFRQRDVTRALKAMIAAGIEGRVEIETSGKLVVVVGKPFAQSELAIPQAANDNSWSDVDAAQVRTSH
jgi:hypothetical protein